MPLFVDEDGRAAETPVGAHAVDRMHGYARVQALILADLNACGMSIRKIGKLFGLSKSNVDRILRLVPDEIAERHRNKRYLARLRGIIDEEPKTFKDLMDRMLAVNGTRPEQVATILGDLGNRRRSLETAVGLKQRAPKANANHD